ncbi:MAG: Y-family DNA polymerase [Limisphaerales bacterium]
MFAVIYIPNFSLQASLRLEPELHARPVVLLDDLDKKATVFQLTQAARETGILEGLTATQAQARCGEVIIRTRSPGHEKSATQVLLQTAYNFSPRIEDTGNGVCTIDLQGLNLLFPSDGPKTGRQPVREWAEKIILALKSSSLHGHVGVAETPNIALHAARYAGPVGVVENSHAFISVLPIESIEPAESILHILDRWGIKTVGAFLELGKDRIAERLGSEALELFDQASSTAIRPLNIVTPEEDFSETIDLQGEIESLEPLLFILNRFVEQLTGRIRALHLVVAELQLRLMLASGDGYESLFRIPSPTDDVRVLFNMLQTHLENVRTDSPIVSVTLSARPSRSDHFQFGLFEASLRDPNQFAETLARLTALCGGNNVGTPVIENTHRPDAFKMRTPQFAATALSCSRRISESLTLRRFRPPIHADVEIEQNEPIFISSLKLNSPVHKYSGPFRSSGDWWEEAKVWQRDEWDIETTGGTLYRIYHANNDWFIEGVYS